MGSDETSNGTGEADWAEVDFGEGTEYQLPNEEIPVVVFLNQANNGTTTVWHVLDRVAIQ